MPDTARRMLATVNSSATIARQPDVPNLILLIGSSPQATYCTTSKLGASSLRPYTGCMTEPLDAGSFARVVLTTAANPEEAERIARTLVDERLAACATLIPSLRSIYRWEGRIEDSTE